MNSRWVAVGQAGVLINRLQVKYGLDVAVSEPVKETGNVDTWKLKVITRPQQKSLPAQRIHIDICALPSYDKKPVTLRNHYGVEMGTSGLIIQAQSREEILADKIIAFAFRPNSVKNRDLWDIGWLRQHNVILPLELVARKITDHRRSVAEFLELLEMRKRSLRDEPTIRKNFVHEMQRFFPPKVISRTVEKEDFWIFLIDVIQIECDRVIQHLTNAQPSAGFEM